jgi:hypothetical protein
VRAAIALPIVSEVIVELGHSCCSHLCHSVAAPEKFLLWLGLFSILYGLVLIDGESVFRLGLGQPQNI